MSSDDQRKSSRNHPDNRESGIFPKRKLRRSGFRLAATVTQLVTQARDRDVRVDADLKCRRRLSTPLSSHHTPNDFRAKKLEAKVPRFRLGF